MEDITNVPPGHKKAIVVDKLSGRDRELGYDPGHALNERHAGQEQRPPRNSHYKQASEEDSIQLSRQQSSLSAALDICSLATNRDSAEETQPRGISWDEARDNSCQRESDLEGITSVSNSAVLQDALALLNQVTHSIEVGGSRLQDTTDIFSLVLKKLESFEKTVDDLRLERDILAKEVSRLQADGAPHSHSPCHHIATCGEGDVDLLERVQALCNEYFASTGKGEQVEDSDDGAEHGAEARGSRTQFYRAVARTFAKQVVSFASDFRTATDHKTLEEDLKRFDFWAEHQVKLFLQQG